MMYSWLGVYMGGEQQFLHQLDIKMHFFYLTVLFIFCINETFLGRCIINSRPLPEPFLY